MLNINNQINHFACERDLQMYDVNFWNRPQWLENLRIKQK